MRRFRGRASNAPQTGHPRPTIYQFIALSGRVAIERRRGPRRLTRRWRMEEFSHEASDLPNTVTSEMLR